MMHSLARPDSGAPPTTTSPEALPSTPSNRHRHHYSSVAEDYRDFGDSSPETGHYTPDRRSHKRPANSQRSFRISVASATSMASGASSSTTSTARRFWAPSPPSSPLGHSSRASSSASSSLPMSPTLSDGASSTASTTATTATISPHAYTSAHAVTYIPPLVDAAHGTLSQRQRRSHSSTFSFLQLKHLAVDLHWLATATPELLRLACKQTAAPLVTVLSASRNPLALSVDSIADAAEAILQIWLAVIELGTLAAASVLFLCLPGLLFSAWLGGCLLCIGLSSWPLNGGSDCCTGSVFHPPWCVNSIGTTVPTSDEDNDSDSDDEHNTPRPSEHWFFVSGMGATTRSLSKTGPRVAGVFGHPVTLIRPHTYGAVADYLSSAILGRLWDKQFSYADALYDHLYPLLTAPVSPASIPPASPPPRIVVLAHNTGATVVSQVLARLTIDVSIERLSQLEIYTFGSLASDFVLPRCMGMAMPRAAPPHIEHIAHVHDPCARFGVLRSVRDDLTARYCGGVFVLGAASPSAHAGRPDARTTGLAAGPTQQPTTRSRRNYRMSFPFTHQKQQQQQLQQYQYLQQQRSTSLYNPHLSRTTSNSSTDLFFTQNNAPAQPTMLSMEDYLTALFGPEPWSMRPDLVDIDSEFVDMDMEGCYYQKASSLSSDAPFLDAAINVDRELAEKREMAAMEAANNDHGKMVSLRRVSKGAHFRLSWTGLGATAKFGTPTAGTSIKAVPKIASSTRAKLGRWTDKDKHPNSRLGGLETARRLCREYDGRPGREVSVLAGYFAEAVVRHREMFGFQR